MFRSIISCAAILAMLLSVTQVQAQTHPSSNDFIATDPAMDSLMCLGVYALVVREDKTAQTPALETAYGNAVKIYSQTANMGDVESATDFSVDSIEQMVKDGPDSLVELQRLCDNEFAK